MTFIVTRVGHLTNHLNPVAVNIKFTPEHDNMLAFLYTFVQSVEAIVLTSTYSVVFTFLLERTSNCASY